MFEHRQHIDMAAWVESARPDPAAYLRRQAVEVILTAISKTASLNASMFLKGGILLGLAYKSPRQTVDIDLTTILPASSGIDERIRMLLEPELPRAAAALGHADLILSIQSTEIRPGASAEKAKFPALKIRVAYAKRNTAQERALRERSRASNVVGLDISFNEVLRHKQVLVLSEGLELAAYGLAELIAEKYRALLQQVLRNRNRRQDVFDLDLLIGSNDLRGEIRTQILETLVEKCRSRNLEPTRTSLEDPDLKMRASAEWDTMSMEIGEVPDFEGCFRRVSEFYRSLPWQ